MTKLVQTKTGSTWNLAKSAKSNLITKISADGQSTEMQILTIIGIAGEHFEFGELKTDLLVKNEFGETLEICEDFIWQ